MDETKYLIDGTEVKVIAKIDNNQFIVTECFEDDEYNRFEGAPRIVDAVFDQPTTKRYHAEVAELRGAVEKLEQRRNELQREIWQSEQDRKAEKQAVKTLRDLLDGKITHVVIWSNSKRDIVPIKTLWDRSDRLVYLGIERSTACRFTWDGNEVYLFKSEAEARAYAQELIDQECKRRAGYSIDSDITRMALKHGLTIAQNHVDAMNAEQRKYIERDIAFNEKLAAEYAEKAKSARKRLEEL